MILSMVKALLFLLIAGLSSISGRLVMCCGDDFSGVIGSSELCSGLELLFLNSTGSPILKSEKIKDAIII